MQQWIRKLRSQIRAMHPADTGPCAMVSTCSGPRRRHKRAVALMEGGCPASSKRERAGPFEPSQRCCLSCETCTCTTCLGVDIGGTVRADCMVNLHQMRCKLNLAAIVERRSRRERVSFHLLDAPSAKTKRMFRSKPGACTSVGGATDEGTFSYVFHY